MKLFPTKYHTSCFQFRTHKLHTFTNSETKAQGKYESILICDHDNVNEMPALHLTSSTPVAKIRKSPNVSHSHGIANAGQGEFDLLVPCLSVVLFLHVCSLSHRCFAPWPKLFNEDGLDEKESWIVINVVFYYL